MTLWLIGFCCGILAVVIAVAVIEMISNDDNEPTMEVEKDGETIGLIRGKCYYPTCPDAKIRSSDK